jgi:asparagine synthase (glutamine-hydrolysing)
LLSEQVGGWMTTPVDVPFLNQKQLAVEFKAIQSGKKPFSWMVWRWINFVRWVQLFDVSA